MSKKAEREATLRERIAAVLGPLQHEPQRIVTGIEWFDGAYGSTPVRIGISAPRGNLSGYEIRVGLAGRPVRVDVRDHRTSVVGLSSFPTGDAAFDASYRVFGYPRETVLEILEPSMRAWIASRYPGADPEIGCPGGTLRIYVPVAGPDAPLPEPDEIRGWIELVINLAARLVGAFDRAYAQVLATQGEPAAQAWLAAQSGAAERRAEARSRVGLLVLLGLGLVIGLPLLCVLAYVILAR